MNIEYKFEELLKQLQSSSKIKLSDLFIIENKLSILFGDTKIVIPQLRINIPELQHYEITLDYYNSGMYITILNNCLCYCYQIEDVMYIIFISIIDNNIIQYMAKHKIKNSIPLIHFKREEVISDWVNKFRVILNFNISNRKNYNNCEIILIDMKNVFDVLKYCNNNYLICKDEDIFL